MKTFLLLNPFSRWSNISTGFTFKVKSSLISIWIYGSTRKRFTSVLHNNNMKTLWVFAKYGRGRCNYIGVIVILVSSFPSFVYPFKILNLNLFFHPKKPFFLSGSTILPILITCLILSAITTMLVKYYVELPTKYSKYKALKVFENKPTISFSNKWGLSCIVECHIWLYSLINSLLPFFIACKLDLSEVTSILNLYWPIKASTKSFHLFTQVLSNHIY